MEYVANWLTILPASLGKDQGISKFFKETHNVAPEQANCGKEQGETWSRTSHSPGQEKEKGSRQKREIFIWAQHGVSELLLFPTQPWLKHLFIVLK